VIPCEGERLQPCFDGVNVGVAETVPKLVSSTLCFSEDTFDAVAIPVAESEPVSATGRFEPRRAIDEKDGVVDAMLLASAMNIVESAVFASEKAGRAAGGWWRGRRQRTASIARHQAGSRSRRRRRDPGSYRLWAVGRLSAPSRERSSDSGRHRISRVSKLYPKARIRRDGGGYRVASCVAVSPLAPRNLIRSACYSR